MRDKIAMIKQRLNRITELAEDGLKLCNGLMYASVPLVHSLTRIETLKVYTSHIRELCKGIDEGREALFEVTDKQVEELILEATKGVADKPVFTSSGAEGLNGSMEPTDENETSGAVDSTLPNRGHVTSGGGSCDNCGANMGDWSSSDCPGEAA